MDLYAFEQSLCEDVIWEIGKVAIGSEWCYSALKDAYRVDSTAVADLTQVPEARKAIINYNITSAKQYESSSSKRR